MRGQDHTLQTMEGQHPLKENLFIFGVNQGVPRFDSQLYQHETYNCTIDTTHRSSTSQRPQMRILRPGMRLLFLSGLCVS